MGLKKHNPGCACCDCILPGCCTCCGEDTPDTVTIIIDGFGEYELILLTADPCPGTCIFYTEEDPLPGPFTSIIWDGNILVTGESGGATYSPLDCDNTSGSCDTFQIGLVEDMTGLGLPDSATLIFNCPP